MKSFLTESQCEHMLSILTEHDMLEAPLMLTLPDGNTVGLTEDENAVELELEGWSYGKRCVLLHLHKGEDVLTFELMTNRKGI